jgi:hypothetical protein
MDGVEKLRSARLCYMVRRVWGCDDGGWSVGASGMATLIAFIYYLLVWGLVGRGG